jgi:hypothetical protein
LNPEDGRYAVPKRPSEIVTTRCVMTQKRAVLSATKIINYELQEKQKEMVWLCAFPQKAVSRIKFPLGIKINTISFLLFEVSGAI